MPAGDVSASDGEAGGFRVAFASTVLSINAWGYWPPEVAEAFGREAAAIGQKPIRVATFVLDAADLKPQGAEGQEAMRTLFKVLAEMKIEKGTFIANNLFTKMQLLRLLRECGLEQRVAADG